LTTGEARERPVRAKREMWEKRMVADQDILINGDRSEGKLVAEKIYQKEAGQFLL
jgi:hypothetical protein